DPRAAGARVPRDRARTAVGQSRLRAEDPRLARDRGGVAQHGERRATIARKACPALTGLARRSALAPARHRSGTTVGPAGGNFGRRPGDVRTSRASPMPGAHGLHGAPRMNYFVYLVGLVVLVLVVLSFLGVL